MFLLLLLTINCTFENIKSYEESVYKQTSPNYSEIDYEKITTKSAIAQRPPMPLPRIKAESYDVLCHCYYCEEQRLNIYSEEGAKIKTVKNKNKIVRCVVTGLIKLFT